MNKRLVVRSKKIPPSFGLLWRTPSFTQDASVQEDRKKNAFVQEGELDEDKSDDNVKRSQQSTYLVPNSASLI